MKLLLENWREYLKEAELRHSETAFKKIYNSAAKGYEKFQKTGEKDKTWRGAVQIPTDEIYYLDNSKIKNGIILTYFGNMKNQKLSELPNLSKQWDQDKKGWNDDFMNQFIKNPFKLSVLVSDESQGLGSMTTGMLKGDGEQAGWAELTVKPFNHSSSEQLQDTVRHELQHLTQKLNGLALQYGETLDKANGDFSQIKTIPFRDVKQFGVGKETTGLRQVSRAQAREQGIGEDERVKRYLGDDFEYETWMSDMLSDFVRFIDRNELISTRELQFAKMKESEALNFLAEQDNIQKRKQIIDMSKRIGMEPRTFVSNIKKAPSFNALAVRTAEKVLRDEEVTHRFAKESRMSDYVKAIRSLLKLRPKEFAGDFVKNLELRLRKKATDL